MVGATDGIKEGTLDGKKDGYVVGNAIEGVRLGATDAGCLEGIMVIPNVGMADGFFTVVEGSTPEGCDGANDGPVGATVGAYIHDCLEVYIPTPQTELPHCPQP